MPATKDGGAIRQMFADISRRYDFLNHLLSFQMDRWWRRRTVEALHIEAGDAVLDVCTGTADLALALSRRVEAAAGGHVVGSDFCPEMLEIGDRKRRKRGEERLTLIAADTLRLPFRDESFDAVTVAFGIRNIQDLPRGLAEMRRVLRAGGRLAVLEFSSPRAAWLRGLYRFYFHHVLPRVGRWFSRHPSGDGAYRYLPASVMDFPRPEAFCAYLEDAGLIDAKAHLLTGGIAALYVSRRPSSSGTLDRRQPLGKSPHPGA